MYPVLAVMLLGVAVFTAAVLRAGRTRAARGSVADEHLEGFGLVGAGGLVLAAAAVVVMGLVADHGGRAELLAMIAFYAYGVYVVVAVGVVRYLRQR